MAPTMDVVAACEGCGVEDAQWQCPTCQAYFCGPDCFKANWKSHKASHSNKTTSSKNSNSPTKSHSKPVKTSNGDTKGYPSKKDSSSTRVVPPPQKIQSVASVAPKSKPIDYSKWSTLKDSDDEEDFLPDSVAQGQSLPDSGVQDLAETGVGRGQIVAAPVPDYLQGEMDGGGAPNCNPVVRKMLDQEYDPNNKEVNRLATHLAREFHIGASDEHRQRFYGEAIESQPEDSFYLSLGIGSVIPLLKAARRGPTLLLDQTQKLCNAAKEIAQSNDIGLAAAQVPEGLDNEEAVKKALRGIVPRDAEHVVIMTELMAEDLISQGIVPTVLAAIAAVKAVAPDAKISLIPEKIELVAVPLESRIEVVQGVDVRPFNAFRQTSSNGASDFWWWPVRLDNQDNSTCSLLGEEKVIAAFDFGRAAEISLDEVKMSFSLDVTKKGRCNAVALWFVARAAGHELSSRPDLVNGAPPRPHRRGTWKQAVHYLGGETTVFPEDDLRFDASITPRFTIRMMQTSPMSVECPPWIEAKGQATLPILPYHFVMLMDQERARLLKSAIDAAVNKAAKRLGRRPRVLDLGSGIGLLGLFAAKQGAEVWCCEAQQLMRKMAREVLAVNVTSLEEPNGKINLLPPGMSTRLEVGIDVDDKFDIIVSEIFDVRLLGEGILPSMRHAVKMLLAPGGTLIPSNLHVYAMPIETRLFQQAEKEHNVDLGTLRDMLRTKDSPVRLDAIPYRPLCDEAVKVFSIDLNNIPKEPPSGVPNLPGTEMQIRVGGKAALAATMNQATIDHAGTLYGHAVWWNADYGHGVMVGNGPDSGTHSWKQMVHWVGEPRWVTEGEVCNLLSCYGEQQMSVDDIHITQEMMEAVQKDMYGASGGAATAVNDKAPVGQAAKEEEDDEDIAEID
eukprot:gnl/MRDRNA2_/MRDRNA2_27477_c0_seq1.p1 gnl/MRDRNA2_/MRDRNA2_27477_c0~~gnl/MRDRNA2_/MRDRNA2_27477_c0_seq1.p1  ORF type:complete len:898 (-),score=175.76 gnl/MRDRNA2_/MRDRNA2_27477_c0_seq1:76-2769(-)